MTPNLYGNLVANTAAGIAGGTGVMPGGTVVSCYCIVTSVLSSDYVAFSNTASLISTMLSIFFTNVQNLKN